MSTKTETKNANHSILKKAILIRETEETLLDLFSKGRLNGTVHTCIGQEYMGAVLSKILIKGDAVFKEYYLNKIGFNYQSITK